MTARNLLMLISSHISHIIYFNLVNSSLELSSDYRKLLLLERNLSTFVYENNQAMNVLLFNTSDILYQFNTKTTPLDKIILDTV